VEVVQNQKATMSYIVDMDSITALYRQTVEVTLWLK
jgi:hypothetical protein